MKIALNEKQYNLLLSNLPDDGEINEVDANPISSSTPLSTSSSTPTDSTSTPPTGAGTTSQTSAPPYPAVGKWESGVTRGPANQIGVTKWSDIVGSTLTRGKANPLKEQTLLGGPPMMSLQKELNPMYDTPLKTYTTFWGEEMKLPANDSVYVSLWKDDKPRVLQFKNAFEKDGEYYWPQTYVGEDNKPYVKNELAPDEGWLKEQFPTGTIKYIETKSDNRTYMVVLTQRGGYGEWKVNPGYFFNDKSRYIPFSPKKYIHTSVTTKVWEWIKENWTTLVQILGSVIAGILTAGASLWVQALVQAGVDLGFAAVTFVVDKNPVGLAMNIFIGCLPFIPAATKLGVKGPLEGLKRLGPKLAVAQTDEQVLSILKGFSKEEQLIISRCLKQLPKAEFEKIVKSKLVRGFMDKAKKGQFTSEWIQKIPPGQLKWWKELLVEGGGALPIMAGGYAYSSIQERKKDEEIVLEFIINNQKPTGTYEDRLKDASNRADSLLNDWKNQK